MIVFDLACDNAHRFEGWFRSSEDFETQRDNGLLYCPTCASDVIAKAPMAPAVPAKGASSNDAPSVDAPFALAGGAIPPAVKRAFEALAKAQTAALKSSKWVGGRFAEEARQMHYGEKDEAAIHGRATRDEAKLLFEEGIAIAPLIVPVAPPDEVN